MKLIHNKKGQAPSIGNLPTFAVLLVVAGVTIAIGAQVMSTIQTNAGFTANSSADNATINALDGLNQMSSFLPTIGIVLAAIVILGLLGLLLFTRARN